MNGMIGDANNSGLRNIHRHAILDLIRFTPGGISRAELARQVGLTRSAVTPIINDFLRADMVRETESGPAGGGRRPILLEINPQRGYVVGVDIGATHLSLLLADMAARVVSEFEAPFDVSQGPQVCLPQIDRHVRTLLDQAGKSYQDVLTFGVGVPGPIAGDGGEVVAPPIMPGWDNFPIRASLQEMWGCAVSLNNDAELGALGEWAYGAGRGERNLVYIKVGSGVGAGLILDNRIYRGATGTAGEIGHVTIQENGPLCTCGNRGCLEALAGGRAIAQQACRAVQSGQRTALSAIHPPDKITAKDVTAAARRGDLVAQKIVMEAGCYLGTAIAGLINLLNPGIVVVGGGVAQTGDLLLEPIRQAVREQGLKAAVQAVRVNAAVLGRRSSSMGAVVQALTIVLHRLSENPAT
ncbi:MAG TPA: ROK family transcriptional regulator [Anaerolineales bacterium]